MPVPIPTIARTCARGMLSRNGPQRTTRLTLRVAWRHVDFNLHMNYASYLEAMEVGRWDWVARAGLIVPWLRNGLRPVVGSVDMHYRKELRPFARYTLETELVGFDRRAVVFTQRFLVGTALHAEGKINALIRSPRGLLTAQEMLDLLPEELRP